MLRKPDAGSIAWAHRAHTALFRNQGDRHERRLCRYWRNACARSGEMGVSPSIPDAQIANFDALGAAVRPGIDVSCYRLAMKRSDASIRNRPKAISS